MASRDWPAWITDRGTEYSDLRPDESVRDVVIFTSSSERSPSSSAAAWQLSRAAGLASSQPSPSDFSAKRMAPRWRRPLSSERTCSTRSVSIPHAAHDASNSANRDVSASKSASRGS